MFQKIKIHYRFEFYLILIVLFFNCFSIQAQNKLDEKFKSDANKLYHMEYSVPKYYRGINVKQSYVANNDYIQSSFIHGIKHKNHAIVISFALIISKPDLSTRGKRIREVSGDSGRINLNAIASEIDNEISELKYVDTLQFKKVNADRGVLYNLKMNNKYMKIYSRCKKLILYKNEWGRAEILFFYNKGDDKLVEEEIKRTWGMLKFKS